MDRAIAFGNPSTERLNISRTFRLSRRVRGQDSIVFIPPGRDDPKRDSPVGRERWLATSVSNLDPIDRSYPYV